MKGKHAMGMLHVHGMVPVSAAVPGIAAGATVSSSSDGLAAASLRGLGIALLVLTIIFAIGAIRGLLPRRAELRARRELHPFRKPAAREAISP
jgi:hypothetical protein